MILPFPARLCKLDLILSWAAVAHLNFRAGQPFRSQFALYLPLLTGLAGATRLMRSGFMLHIG